MLISNAVEVMVLGSSSLNLLELSYTINGIVQTIFLERTFCLKAHHPSTGKLGLQWDLNPCRTELKLSTRESLNQCTTIWYQLSYNNI